jgi:hypothetical protein
MSETATTLPVSSSASVSTSASSNLASTTTITTTASAHVETNAIPTSLAPQEHQFAETNHKANTNTVNHNNNSTAQDHTNSTNNHHDSNNSTQTPDQHQASGQSSDYVTVGTVEMSQSKTKIICEHDQSESVSYYCADCDQYLCDRCDR